jgi:hypothetical protein
MNLGNGILSSWIMEFSLESSTFQNFQRYIFYILSQLTIIFCSNRMLPWFQEYMYFSGIEESLYLDWIEDPIYVWVIEEHLNICRCQQHTHFPGIGVAFDLSNILPSTAIYYINIRFKMILHISVKYKNRKDYARSLFYIYNDLIYVYFLYSQVV